MNDYEQLYKMLDKKSISMKVLRELMANEHVVSITPSTTKNSKNSYDIRLDNDDLFIVKVEDEFKGIFSFIDKLQNKN